MVVTGLTLLSAFVLLVLSLGGWGDGTLKNRSGNSRGVTSFDEAQMEDANGGIGSSGVRSRSSEKSAPDKEPFFVAMLRLKSTTSSDTRII